MSFVRAAVRRVVGLFVGDWLQSAIVLVALLAGQLVWFARADGRPNSSPR